MCCFNTDYGLVFLRRGISCLVASGKTLDTLSSGCAWFGGSLRFEKPYFFPVLGATGVTVRGLRPL
jgi:hypothetical protein